MEFVCKKTPQLKYYTNPPLLYPRRLLPHADAHTGEAGAVAAPLPGRSRRQPGRSQEQRRALGRQSSRFAARGSHQGSAVVAVGAALGRTREGEVEEDMRPKASDATGRRTRSKAGVCGSRRWHTSIRRLAWRPGRRRWDGGMRWPEESGSGATSK
jgi:hypothetical protein